MSDILIQSSRMKECEDINLGKNESKVIYQDFDTKINCMNITLAENSNLEILLYNSSVSLNANLGNSSSIIFKILIST